MNEDKIMRKVSIILVSILIVVLMLLMAYVQVVQAEDDIPYPNKNPLCDKPYILKWIIPECLYCDGIGDYYLFSCYDSNNTNLILKHVCVYPTDDGDTIIEEINLIYAALSIRPLDCAWGEAVFFSSIGVPARPALISYLLLA